MPECGAEDKDRNRQKQGQGGLQSRGQDSKSAENPSNLILLILRSSVPPGRCILNADTNPQRSLKAIASVFIRLAIFPLFPLLLALGGTGLGVNLDALDAKETEEGVLITDGGQPVLFYQRRTKSYQGKMPRANYIHPLYGLDGQVLTEDFPEDHLHHRGVFLGWHQLTVDGRARGEPVAGREYGIRRARRRSSFR